MLKFPSFNELANTCNLFDVKQSFDESKFISCLPNSAKKKTTAKFLD